MRRPFPGDLGPVDYASRVVPSEYHCGKCGALGVKLWRDYQTFLNHQSILCADCACTEQKTAGESYSVRAREDGRVCATTTYNAEVEPQLHKIFGGSDEGGDQIGWRVPAVPTADGSTFWGYTSVPDDACRWWYALPLRKAAP